MARKEKPVQYGTKNKSSKKGSTKMNSAALEVSKSNLEAILSDSLLRSFGYTPQKGYDIEVELTVPDTVPIKINYIKQEVAH